MDASSRSNNIGGNMEHDLAAAAVDTSGQNDENRKSRTIVQAADDSLATGNQQQPLLTPSASDWNRCVQGCGVPARRHNRLILCADVGARARARVHV